MALADIYQLIHNQSYLGQAIQNVYFYRREDAGSDHADLLDAWVADVMPSVMAIQDPKIITDTVVAKNLENFSDFGETIVDDPGTYDAGQILPIFNAIGYTLRSANRLVRPGSKRITGINESVQLDGIITEAAYITRMETLRVALDTVIGTDPLFFTPIIVKRVKYEVPDSDPVRFAYRLPETDEELVLATLLGVTTSTHITHQVSRQN